MQRIVLFTFLGIAGLLAIPSASGETFSLRYDRLGPALESLKRTDQDIVSDAISLLKRGDHVLALSRLSALNKHNPDNSSLRILASYALLQAGNLLGAFDEADMAHKAPNGNAYKCWFMAKIALLSGNRAVCEREIEHVKKSGDLVAEVQEIEKELNKN